MHWHPTVNVVELEAGAGIEPANSGFADRDLTTWLPRRVARADNIVVAALVSSAEHRYIGAWHKRLYNDFAFGGTICSRTETHSRRRKFAGARISQRGR